MISRSTTSKSALTLWQLRPLTHRSLTRPCCAADMVGPPDALSAIRAEDQPGKRVLEHKLLPNPGGGLAGKTDLLRKLEILLRHQRRMQALKRLIGRRVFVTLDALLDYTVLDALDLLAPAPADFSRIDGVRHHLADGGVGPQVAVAGGNAHVIEGIGNRLGSRLGKEHGENASDHLCLRWVRLQGIAFVVG